MSYNPNLRTLQAQSSIDTAEWAAERPLPPSMSTLQAVERNRAETSSSPSLQSLEYENDNGTSLAPVDRGLGAWSFVLAAFGALYLLTRLILVVIQIFAAFFVQAIVWAFPNSYGVFLDAYLNDPRYASQKQSGFLLPLAGTLSTGIIYLSSPVIHGLTGRRRYLRRPLLWLGTVLCWAGLFGASYVTKVEQLLVLQGIVYSIGGSFLYHPCVAYMSEWFVARRGLANGIMFAGTGFGSLLLPIALRPLFNRFGTQITLRILSIAIVCPLLLLLPFVKGRLPESRVPGPTARSTDRSWMRHRALWMILFLNTVQGFAYFVPLIWLPTFTTELRSSADSSLPLAALNGANVFGRIAMGTLSDRANPWLLGSMTLFSTSLATFVLWGVLSRNMAGLVAYGIAYGGFAGGWSSLWTGFIKPIAKDDPTLSSYMIGLLMLSRGLGNVLSTPISTSLLQGNASNDAHGKTGFDVAGGRFERVILYVGTCFAGAAVLAFAGWGMEKKRLLIGR